MPAALRERGRVIDPGSSGQLGAYVAAQDPAAGRDHAAGLDVEREEPVARGQPGSLRDLSTRAVEEDGALTTEVPAAAAAGTVEGGSVRVNPHRFAVLEISHDDGDRAGFDDLKRGRLVEELVSLRIDERKVVRDREGAHAHDRLALGRGPRRPTKRTSGDGRRHRQKSAPQSHLAPLAILPGAAVIKWRDGLSVVARYPQLR